MNSENYHLGNVSHLQMVDDFANALAKPPNRPNSKHLQRLFFRSIRPATCGNVGFKKDEDRSTLAGGHLS